MRLRPLSVRAIVILSAAALAVWGGAAHFVAGVSFWPWPVQVQEFEGRSTTPDEWSMTPFFNVGTDWYAEIELAGKFREVMLSKDVGALARSRDSIEAVPFRVTAPKESIRIDRRDSGRFRVAFLGVGSWKATVVREPDN